MQQILNYWKESRWASIVLPTDQVQNLTVENKIQDLQPEQNARYSNLQAGAGKLNLTRDTKCTRPKS